MNSKTKEVIKEYGSNPVTWGFVNPKDIKKVEQTPITDEVKKALEGYTNAVDWGFVNPHKIKNRVNA